MTYIEIKNELHADRNGSWQQMAERLIATAAGNAGVVVRLLFFSSFADNKEYSSRKKIVECLCEKYFQSLRPLISLIAQKPLGSDLLLEVHSVPEHVEVKEVSLSFGHYLRIETEDYKEVLGGGLCADDLELSVREQSETAFRRMSEILKAEKMNWGDVVRQWNYLERITEFSHGNQRYQDFNDVRAAFYSSSDWPSGYPSATGIGAQWGGVQIDFNAVRGKIEILPLDNDWQRAAHVYTEEVLISHPDLTKETPKFERGKVLTDHRNRTIYISGTAAIRGENSVQGGVVPQAIITLENIQHLIGLEEGKEKLPAQSEAFELLRVYLKYETDVEIVKKELDRLCPSVAVAYLYADICRDELLIEIEGIART